MSWFFKCPLVAAVSSESSCDSLVYVLSFNMPVRLKLNKYFTLQEKNLHYAYFNFLPPQDNQATDSFYSCVLSSN